MPAKYHGQRILEGYSPWGCKESEMTEQSTHIFIKYPLLNTLKKHILSRFESVLMRWMKLEPIIQSEVSQKEKHQYSILMHIYGI